MIKYIKIISILLLLTSFGFIIYKPYMNFSTFLRAKCFLTDACVIDLSDYKKYYKWDEFCLQHRRGIYANQQGNVECDFCYLISLQNGRGDVLIKDRVRINVDEELFDTHIRSKNTCYGRNKTTIFVEKYSWYSILKYHVTFQEK